MKMSDSNLDSPDKPPVLMVFLIVFSIFIFVSLFWFFAEGLLSQITTFEQSKIETGMGNKTRLSYIEKETQYLNSTSGQADGVHKISIDEAMAKVIEKENK